jgi:hypothetical protein
VTLLLLLLSATTNGDVLPGKGTNPVTIVLGLVFGRLDLAGGDIARDVVSSGGGAGGGIRGKGRTELEETLVVSFEAGSADVPATSG